MKVDIGYESYHQYCAAMADDIVNWGADELVTIMRGGQFACHIISKITKLETGVIYPKHDKFQLINQSAKKIVFVEDMISTGRTYDYLVDFMKPYSNIEWKIAPVFLDGDVNESDYPNLLTYGFKSKHWVVLPYEDREVLREDIREYHRDS